MQHTMQNITILSYINTNVFYNKKNVQNQKALKNLKDVARIRNEKTFFTSMDESKQVNHIYMYVHGHLYIGIEQQHIRIITHTTKLIKD